MKTMHKLAAVAVVMLSSFGTASAGTGGSNAGIVAAIHSGSQDSVIAEVERAEGLMCDECVTTVIGLTEDSRYAVREVAGWWIAKRPALVETLTPGFLDDLGGTDSARVRNAADFLGSVVSYKSLPALTVAISHDNLDTEAKLAIVRAVGALAHTKGNAALQTAMGSADAEVRAAAIHAWRDVLHQKDAAPVVKYLTDSDAHVRAEAATVVGAFGTTSAVSQLTKLVLGDKDATVRRNAAWALGKIGDASARPALVAAVADPSGLVRNFAQVALTQLH